MKWRYAKSFALMGVAAGAISMLGIGSPRAMEHGDMNSHLAQVLRQAGFTGAVQASIPTRLGRPINGALFDLGRLIFHDNILGLHNDNSCAGCHSAAAGFGDTQSIAIGTDNNAIVGPDRTGPRNQRRAPQAANSAFYPAMMLNTRFGSRRTRSIYPKARACRSSWAAPPCGGRARRACTGPASTRRS